MTDATKNEVKILITELFNPSTVMLSPDIESKRTFAGTIEVTEATLESVPNVNGEFIANHRPLFCLRVQKNHVPEGFSAVVFAIKRQSTSRY